MSSALSGTTADYTYDADGQRLTATQGSTTPGLSDLERCRGAHGLQQQRGRHERRHL